MEDSIIVQISKYLSKAYDKKTFGVCWEEPRELYLFKPIELNGMKFEPGLLQKHSHKKTLAFAEIGKDAKRHLDFSFNKDELFDAIDITADLDKCHGNPFELGIIAGRIDAAQRFFNKKV